MKTEKNGAEKITFISIVVAIAFTVILLRLWQLQILQGEDYRKISESNRLRIIGVPAPRGIIYDRNGIPLVKDTPYFSASVIVDEFDINRIDELSQLLHIPVEELLGKMEEKTDSPFQPVRLKERLPFSDVSYIEARRSDFPGLIIEVDVSREYIYGATGAHVIGYLGKLNPAQSASHDFKDVPPQAFIGQWGVEKLFDKSLRGIAGQRIIEVDALGREIRLFTEKPPVKGTDLTLSIDIALQQEAEKAFAGRTGALVALEPDTGEILGLVSLPSFNPNKFTKGITQEEWTALSSDKQYPMLNRAIQSQYPPGSTFKIITAIAALEEEVLNERTKVECKGSIKFGKWQFGCWKKTGHGIVSLHRAIVESCDVYFYEAGKRVGIDKIAYYAEKFGLGKTVEFPFGTEKTGLIPTSEWKIRTKKTKWFLGETFINAIGQGYVSVTPFQNAVMISAISNGGTIFKPSILKGSSPELVSSADISPRTMHLIKDSLAGVVSGVSGTGWAARSTVTSIAGKTGTSQVVGIRKDSKDLPEKFRDHAWFVAYAPVDKSEIALSVFVEHGGHGGTAAAPIAKKAIEAYFLPEEKKKELLNVQN